MRVPMRVHAGAEPPAGPPRGGPPRVTDDSGSSVATGCKDPHFRFRYLRGCQVAQGFHVIAPELTLSLNFRRAGS